MSDIAGRIRPTPPALRYVILRHDGIPEPHFDLMFESAPGSLLMTWRSPNWPIERETPLVKLDDHRRDYLDYQGPVSGNRGHVTRVAAGVFQLKRRSDTLWVFTFRDLVARRQLAFRHDSTDHWSADLATFP